MGGPDPEKKPPEAAGSPAAPESEDDFWNCKGRCGYTRWCAACMAERKKKEIEEEWRRWREESEEEGTPP
jgi:hypothetical protein